MRKPNLTPSGFSSLFHRSMSGDMEEAELPLGFKFCPTASECLVYLNKKVDGKSLPSEGVVLERNPYDLRQLDDIFLASERKDLYFFTKLQQRNKLGSHVNRSVGKGTWRGEQLHKVKNEKGFVVGSARTLSYTENGSLNNKRLIMTEYALPSSALYNPLRDWVICHVKKNTRWRERKKIVKSAAESPFQGQEAPTADDSNSPSLVAECSSKCYSMNETEVVAAQNLRASMGDEDPFLGAIVALPKQDDDLLEYLLRMPVAFDFESPAENQSLSSAVADESYTCAVEATPINNLPPSMATEAEFPPLQSLVVLEDVKNEFFNTREFIDYNMDNQQVDMSSDASEYFGDQNLQFTPSFMN